MAVLRWIFYIVALFAVLIGGLYLYAPYNNGPLEIFPGGEMSGPAGTETDWEFTKAYGQLDLEVRPNEPYSVRVNFIYKDGNIYIDPATDRLWYPMLQENQNVRIRFDEDIYSVKAVLVTDEAEKEGMDPTRIIYRLEMMQ